MISDFEEHLHKLEIPVVEMKNHQEQLRRELLTSSHWDRKPSLLSSFILYVKGGEEIMKNRKLAVLGVALSVIVLAVVASTAILPKNTATAYAKEVAQQSYQAVSTLTPEQKEALKKEVHMVGDPLSVLEEAKNAKDLTVLTYDEFVSQNPNIPMPDKQRTDLRNAKFLHFTNSDGMKITLGVNQNNLPVLMIGAFGNPPSDAETEVKGEVNYVDEKGTFTVNGKKYTAPADTNGPSSVEVKGGEVYINGVKATPEE